MILFALSAFKVAVLDFCFFPSNVTAKLTKLLELFKAIVFDGTSLFFPFLTNSLYPLGGVPGLSP